jgi:hypothetical protein
MMKPSWVDGRVDALLAALHEFGMSVSRAAAMELIHEHVQWVSSQMGISPTAARRYLTDEALADLARTIPRRAGCTTASGSGSSRGTRC